jgi:hypothetical protein
VPCLPHNECNTLLSQTDLEKEEAILTLGNLAHNNDANKVFIAKSRAIFPLVSLLLKGTPRAKEEAARTIGAWCAAVYARVLCRWSSLAVSPNGMPRVVFLVQLGIVRDMCTPV